MRFRRLTIPSEDVSTYRPLEEPALVFPTSDSFVYLIYAPELRRAKIGISVDVKERFETIQRGSPTPLGLQGYFPGGRMEEQALHDEFSSDRVFGEWFAWSSSLLERFEAEWTTAGSRLAPDIEAYDLSQLQKWEAMF